MLTNWFGNRLSSAIVEDRPQLDHTGRRVDLVVDRFELAGGDLGRAGAVIGGDLQRRTGVRLLLHLRQVVLGQGEDHRNRLRLRDDDDAARQVRRRHIIAGVDLAQPDPAGDRRGDVTIDEVEFLRVDLRLVDPDLRPVLRDGIDLVVARLRRDRVLRRQGVVALEIDLGASERGLILGELRLVLLQRHLVGPRVDLGEKVALLDVLALLEADRHQIAADLRLHGHRGERRHGAEPIQCHRHAAALRRRDADRGRDAGRPETAGLRMFRGAREIPDDGPDDGRDQEQPEQRPQPRPPPRSLARRRRDRCQGFGWRLFPILPVASFRDDKPALFVHDYPE